MSVAVTMLRTPQEHGNNGTNHAAGSSALESRVYEGAGSCTRPPASATASSTIVDTSPGNDVAIEREQERPLGEAQSVTSNSEALAIASRFQDPSSTPSLNIAEYKTTDILTILSALLQKITSNNDRLAAAHSAKPQSNVNTSSSFLAFHARNIPSISIHSYLTRILRYCPTSNEIFISLLVYFDRMSRAANADAAARYEGMPAAHVFALDSFNVHRLVIAAVTVASKFSCDVFYTNSRYAKVGGIPLSELNHLELQFLLYNDFRLTISVEELQSYADQLLRFWILAHGDEHTSEPS